jgi:hypothetical protein
MTNLNDKEYIEEMKRMRRDILDSEIGPKPKRLVKSPKLKSPRVKPKQIRYTGSHLMADPNDFPPLRLDEDHFNKIDRMLTPDELSPLEEAVSKNEATPKSYKKLILPKQKNDPRFVPTRKTDSIFTSLVRGYNPKLEDIKDLDLDNLNSIELEELAEGLERDIGSKAHRPVIGSHKVETKPVIETPKVETKPVIEAPMSEHEKELEERFRKTFEKFKLELENPDVETKPMTEAPKVETKPIIGSMTEDISETPKGDSKIKTKNTNSTTNGSKGKKIEVSPDSSLKGKKIEVSPDSSLKGKMVETKPIIGSRVNIPKVETKPMTETPKVETKPIIGSGVDVVPDAPKSFGGGGGHGGGMHVPTTPSYAKKRSFGNKPLIAAALAGALGGGAYLYHRKKDRK